MASDIPPEATDIHNVLVHYLGTQIVETKLNELKNLFRDNPLTPVDIDSIKDIYGLFACLRRQTTIDVGDYSQFVPKLQQTNPNLVGYVTEAETKIKNIIDRGPSPAEQPRSGGPGQQQSTDRQAAMATNISDITTRQAVMATNISDIATRQDVMATNISDIATRKGTITRDIHHLKNDVAAVKDTVNVLSANKDIRPDLKPMIETAKARIKKEKEEKEFYPTEGFRDAKKKLLKNKVVVIKGNTGDGKTAIAVQLLHWLSEEKQAGQPLQLHKIENLSLFYPNLKLITFIDDIFGEKEVSKTDVGEWNKRVSDVKTCFLDEQTETNFLVITVRNEVFNALEKRSKGTIFTEDNLIDLSSHTYKIAKEKEELLKMYKPENFLWTDEEKTKITTYAPNIGFPQCCQLFCNSKELQKERARFFENPFHFLNEALSRLQECSALLYLFLNDGTIKVKDLDQNNEKVNEKLLEEAFDINLIDGETDNSKLTCKKKLGFVKESLEKLEGFLVVKEKHWLFGEDLVYRFIHNSVYVAVALLYGQATPIGFIQNCPSKSLSYLTTSKTATNMIVISSDYYTVMCERLLREFECMGDDDDTCIGSLDVWNDPVFVKTFVRLLNDRKVDKLAVLNKACYSGAEECVLYLLSEGVKPNMYTAFLSLVSSGHCDDSNRQVCLLRKIVVYLDDETKLAVLNKACDSGVEECVLYLLSEGVKPNEDTALLLVSRHWNDRNRQVCLLRKMVVYLNDETKLDVLNEACDSRAEECVLYLLSEGVKPNKDTVFNVVVGESVKVLDKILTYDITPTARDKYNNNVLHVACLLGREEMVTLLCDTYPHLVHDTNDDGQTPLHFVARKGDCSMFQTVERCVLNSLYRVEDQQHQCESVDGRVIHRNCVCAQYMTQLLDGEGRTVLHESCEEGWWGSKEVCIYLCQSYPTLTTAVSKDGKHCLHFIAGSWESDVDMFTECEAYVKQYQESTGGHYDITTILDNKGESVLDKAKEMTKERMEERRTKNDPLLDYLIKEFGKQK